MSSVGQMLRGERERQNRTISEFAQRTCISSRYLEAIEADDLKPIPGGFFYKSFVKQYVNALGLEYSDFEQAVERMVPHEQPDPLPALSQSYQVAKTEGRTGTFYNHRATWGAVLLVGVLTVVSSVYSYWQRHDGTVAARQNASAEQQPVAEPPASTPAPAPIESQPQATQASEPPPQAANPQPTEPAAASPQPAVTSPPTSDQASVTPQLGPNGRISVDLQAVEKTWISVTSDGKTVFRGVLDRSENKKLEVSANAKLLTGNAAGLEVRANGKSLGPLGPRGQVRVVVFNPEHVQIFAPRKM